MSYERGVRNLSESTIGRIKLSYRWICVIIYLKKFYFIVKFQVILNSSRNLQNRKQ